MYDFKPRIPLDHALELVQILRGQKERERGDVMILVGAIFGEIGALIKQGLVTVSDQQSFDLEDVERFLTNVQARLEAAQNQVLDQNDPNFDPTPWIPIILKLIELWLSRRG